MAGRTAVDSRPEDGRLSDAQIAQYLHRVGHTGPVEATEVALRALIAAHGSAIAFENLDPLMGIPVADLGAEALCDKMVRRRRGGYCFEHNGLFAGVLEGFGFGVQSLTARVVWQNPAGVAEPPTGLTHQLLAVTVPGTQDRLLVDVGFGGQTLTSPIRFVPDEVQATRHEPYRLTVQPDRYEHRWVLHTLIGDRWRPLYTFADQPRPPIDLLMGSWYVSTHPDSIFVRGLSASLVTDDARWNLRGRHLSIHHVGGPSEQVTFDNASQVLDTLMHRFGLDVGGIGDVHARITEVLDS
ncbi:arylamine N-acetyltransferase family protein [Mycolicibacterium palauense]|uniref:arylamine N-acetyltransferase family protein n=1 Tax=Mycolicibacterium palauense TaxID=2034511 RepID=UPI000BFF1202|nr:arylamine N-acetyltransferase [Mycolicibacterium palauense]